MYEAYLFIIALLYAYDQISACTICNFLLTSDEEWKAIEWVEANQEN